jgi:hypothetical protein
MKSILSIAVAAAALMAMPSIAMAKDCGARPSKLSLPNGASASEEQMKATQGKFPGYAKEVSTYLHCLSDEIKAGTAEYEGVTADWTKQQAAFKNAAPK